MNKNTLFTLVAVIVGLILLTLAAVFISSRTGGANLPAPTDTNNGVVKSDYKNISYTIEGKAVTLTNGRSEMPIVQGSASKEIVQFFGNEATGDLNGDGLADTAFLLTQTSGGTGVFYHIVVALKTQEGYIGTNSINLGDRIAPQTTEIKDKVLAVNYAIRKPGEPMTTSPSAGKTMWIKVDTKTNEIIEWVKDFEGEADPAVMKLDMKKWVWQSTELNDGTVIKPNKVGAFALSFTAPNKFSASTDCNGVGGEYVAKGNTITFQKMMSTLMFCEGSQESVFSTDLSNVASYFFTSKGELILELKFDSGVMTFR